LRCLVIKFGRNRNTARYLAADYHRHRLLFERHPHLVFLVEECVDYARIKAAHDVGVPIVCCPHNIETFQSSIGAKDFYSGEELPHGLHRELTFMAIADRIFTVSSEESWLLANYGATAEWLPYFPPASEATRLAAIRAKRETAGEKHGFLLVASCDNTKNAEGMRAFARLVAELPEVLQRQVCVAGFSTEKVREVFSSTKCRFLGELPAAELEALFVQCTGAILHQSQGAGALTRVPEMLCAGIPVICSSHAARSARHYDGVQVYQSTAELCELMQKPARLVPLPSRPESAEERLACALKSSVGNSRPQHRCAS
jgi:hypothetical protein